MKFAVAICFLAILLVSSTARVSRLSEWYKLAQKVQKLNGPDDIWTDCTDPGAKAKIGEVTIKPDPPKIGENLNVVAHVDFLEKISDGSVDVDLKFDGIEFINLNLKLCDEAPLAGLQCPIDDGQTVLNVTQLIPEEAPKGNYTGKATVKDQDGNELFCINLKFPLA